jgi:hypothetical protein
MRDHPIIKTKGKPYTVGWRKVKGRWLPVFTQTKKGKKESIANWKESVRLEQERIDAFNYAIDKEKEPSF